MNQNRGNNRRRGRGGNRQQGGHQANRIDSRARGNAPQLLDKYKKLAHDASMNGDRVQSEYYLQFADHYFRVIADTKALKDEARAKREGDRDQDDSDDDDSDDNDRSSRNDRRQSRGRGRNRDNDDRQQASDEGQAGVEGEPGKQDGEKKPRRSRAKANGGDGPNGLDPSALPPAIGADDSDAAEEKPKRKRRTPPRDDDDGALEAVG